MIRTGRGAVRVRGAVLLTLSLVAQQAGPAQPVTDTNAKLAEGIRQVGDGDLEAAVLTLDAATRELAGLPDRGKDLARAYLYLGVAYLHLGQDSLARIRFQQALQQDPSLRPGEREFPLKVRRAFGEAQRAFEERRTVERAARRSRGKGALILAGTGAVAAGAAALAITRERSNTPPSAEILVTPQGAALASVTTLSFSARGSDPDGDTISYWWALGDGTTAVGPQVSHVYRTGGVYTVRLEASDGLVSSSSQRIVTVRSLSGRWRLSAGTVQDVTSLTFEQPGRILNGCLEPLGTCGCAGLTFSPRQVQLRCDLDNIPHQGVPCFLLFRGEADAALQTISGSLSCVDVEVNGTCHRCRGEQAFTLTRE